MTDQLTKKDVEIRQLKALLHTLVRKGTDGHWYTSQHGDADVTYNVRDLLDEASK